jgi:hypothetical protein
MATKRVSITTTCLCINTILANPEHWTGRCRWDSIVPSLPATSDDLPKPFNVKPALISLNDAMRALEGDRLLANILHSPLSLFLLAYHTLLNNSLWPLVFNTHLFNRLFNPHSSIITTTIT